MKYLNLTQLTKIFIYTFRSPVKNYAMNMIEQDFI